MLHPSAAVPVPDASTERHLPELRFQICKRWNKNFPRHLAVKALLLLGALLLGGFSAAVHADADLVLNHSDFPDPGPAGGVFTYTLRIDNNGPGPATAVTLTDTLPAGSTFVSVATTAGSCAQSAGTVSCSLGDIPFTSLVTSFQTVTIKVVLPTAGVWTNVATASASTVDPNSGNNVNVAQPTTAQTAADMRIVATPSAATVIAGVNYSYSLVSTNLGPDALAADSRQTVSFTVPGGAAITSVPTGSGWSCTPSSGYPRSSGTISCSRTGALAVNASTTLTVPTVLNVAGTVTAAFDVAAFKGDGSAMPDGNLDNNTSTVDVASNTGSDVSIAKTAAPASVAQSANVTYTLTPRLNGGMPPGSTGSGLITVTDTLGAGLNLVSATGMGWTCGNAGQLVTCTRPGPYTGGNYTNMPTITVVATAALPGTLSNSTTIAIPETDPVPANNTASVNIVSTDQVDLRMTKSTSFNPVVAGQAFNYTLVVRNLGPLAAQAGDVVTVTDTIPAGVTLRAAATGSGWSCSPTSGLPAAGPVVLTCSRTLAAAFNVNNDLPTITVPVAQTASGAVANTGCVAFTGLAGRNDANTANNCSTATASATASGAEADLVLVSKTAAPNPVDAGENLTYVISVRNDGPSSATNVVVSDTLGSLVGTGSLQSATPSQGSCSPSAPANGTSISLSCNLGTILNGATASVTVVVRPSITVTGARTNTASVFSQDIGDPNRTNNSGSATSTVTAKVDVQVTKTANPASAPAGATVTYVTTVRNNGPSTANTVSMTDTLPANAVFIAMSTVSGGGSCSTQPAPGDTGGELICAWASINSGTQQTVTYTLRPLGTAEGQDLVNNVAVTTATLETNFANNTTTTTTPVTPAELDVLVNKVDDADPIDLGANTRYTVTIGNGGPSYGTNLVMTDVFPDPAASPTAIFSYQGGLTVDNGGTCTEPPVGATAGTLTCTFPGIASGVVATVAYDMKAEAITVAGAFSGTAFNKVNVRVDEAELLMDNNEVVEATTTRRVSIATDLGLTKTTAVTTVNPGMELPYTLTVTNHGPLESNGAQVIDVLPAGVSFVSAPGCNAVAGSVTCAVGVLPVGESRSFIITVLTSSPYTGDDPLVNAATLDAPGDTNPGNNSGEASAPLQPKNVTSIPTLSEWMLVVLAGLMPLSVLVMRKRDTRQRE